MEELGWDRARAEFQLDFEGETYRFELFAEKRAFAILRCLVHRTVIANRGLLRRLQQIVARRHHEHILVFYCEEPQKQVWQWSTVRPDGKRRRHREHPFFSSEPPTGVLSRLAKIRFTLDEEETAMLGDAVEKVRSALDVKSELELFSRYPNIATKGDALAVRMAEGDEDSYHQFVALHQQLARKQSRMLIRWVNENVDDAFQVAMIGIMKASRKFDPTRGYQFSTIAGYYLRAVCQRHAASFGLPIRVPSHAFWPAYRFEFRHQKLIATYGNPLPDELLDAELQIEGLTRRQWEAFEASKNTLRFSDLDRQQFGEVLARAPASDLPLKGMLHREMVDAAIMCMGRIRERDQQVLALRYGLEKEAMTLEQVAGVMGVTRERIRQIQKRAEAELILCMKQEFPSFFVSDEPKKASETTSETDNEEVSEPIDEPTIPRSSKPPNKYPPRRKPSLAQPSDPCPVIASVTPSDFPSAVLSQQELSVMSQWVFAELSGASVRRDPQETELFKTENAGENEYSGTDALVREVIQNSMDAGTGDGPVRIRFGLHPNSELPTADTLAKYFSRLEPALGHRDVSFNSDGAPDLDLGFLVCEDFGTCGLSGDVGLSRDPPEGHRQREDFFWFWRNIGRSGKIDDDLGRWGLGKTVYRAASRVGCMLGLTVRDSDKRKYLMGQAVLRLHEHNGVEYAPEGFWCSGTASDGLPIPISDSEKLDQFADDWSLTRTTEPGLSVVVPYVTAALQTESILRLVAINFFVPIIKGDLIVDVAGPNLPNGASEVRIDSSTIAKVCENLSWNGLVKHKQSCPPPLSLVQQSIAINASDVVTTKLLGTSGMPTIKNESFADKDREDLQLRFKNEELVAVCVRAALPKKSGGHEEGELIVYLQRQSGTDRFESYYVREGMTITRLNSKRSLRGVKAWVMVEPGHLASLLGDTEGPAHISWDTSNDERPNRTWKTWKGRVRFFSKIVDAVAEYLTPKIEDADFDLLSDFFSVEDIKTSSKRRKPGEKGKNVGTFAPPVPNPRWYRSAPKAGGFRISSAPSLPVPENAILRVSIAYDMAGGNPLRNWSRFDFDFRAKDKKVKFKGNGIKANLKEGNVIDITITNSEFELTASGFDVHRDLFVRIDELNSDEDS